MAFLFKRADFLCDNEKDDNEEDDEKADDDVDRISSNSWNPHSSMLPLQCTTWPWLAQKKLPHKISLTFLSESDNALKMES